MSQKLWIQVRHQLLLHDRSSFEKSIPQMSGSENTWDKIYYLMSYSQGLKMGNLQAMDHEGQFTTAPKWDKHRC